MSELPQHQPFAVGERRRAERQAVAVPAIVTVGDRDYTAMLVNIVDRGALVETAAPLEAGVAVSFGCGSINTDAMVVWANPGRAGVNFVAPLAQHQLTEQVLRSRAVESRENVASFSAR